MASANVAQTPQEFFDKYKSKKFRADSAGLCIILEYTYQSYLVRYGNPENLPERLYSPARYDSILAKGMASERERDRWLISGMQSLVEWIPTIYDSATTAREAANMAIISAISSINSSVFMIEKISGFYDHDPETLENQDSKAALIDDLVCHEQDIRNQYEKTRDYIKNSLCYVHAYNTFIDLLKGELDIPEMLFFQIETDATEKYLSALNETGKAQYEKLIKLDTGYTEITSYDETIELIPAPIPEENLRRSTGSTIWAIYHGGAWSSAFSDMVDGYWRRRIPNG